MPEIKKRGGLLKGSDVVAAKKKIIGGVILAVRSGVKGIDSPLVIDFDADVLAGISSWPCNQTNTERLADLISNLTENWVGWGLVLSVEEKNNPKLAAKNGVDEYLVPSLVVHSVMKPQEAAKKRATKPKYDNTTYRASLATSAPVVDTDKPPF